MLSSPRLRQRDGIKHNMWHFTKILFVFPLFGSLRWRYWLHGVTHKTASKTMEGNWIYFDPPQSQDLEKRFCSGPSVFGTFSEIMNSRFFFAHWNLYRNDQWLHRRWCDFYCTSSCQSRLTAWCVLRCSRRYAKIPPCFFKCFVGSRYRKGLTLS